MTRPLLLGIAFLLLAAPSAHAAHWPAMQAPLIKGASGYAPIPGAAIPVKKDRVYKVVYNATLGADKPEQIVPALDMAGSELNLFAVAGAPIANARFVVVFHGPAMDALLDDAHYRARYHVANPNLPVIADMKRAGTRFYVCGQNLAAEDVDPKTLTPDVIVAADALIALMTFGGDGYTILNY